MIKVLKENRFWIIIILLAALAAGGFSIYKYRSTKLLDKTAYKEFKTSMDEYVENGPGFQDQKSLRSFIESWADEHELEYKEDKYGNIIFDRPAVKRKKYESPTLVLVSINYETAPDNSRLLACAAAIALSDLESGRKTVVFADDEKALGAGYKGLNKKYISSKSKVIYLDYGSSTYLSTASFEERISEIIIPVKHEDNTCDTAVRIKITGIDSGVPGPAIGKQPDPISALSTLLTRLKSKSVTYRLADLDIGDNGNMYPVSLDATITLNSYSVKSFTSYIDKRIKAWEKAYSDNYENLEYTYEVIDDTESIPKTVFTADATDKLAGVLYMIQNGTYRYSDSDAIPSNKEAGDVYGINCILDLPVSEKSIKVKLLTQGYNDSFTDRIIYDNKAAADVYECNYKTTESVIPFINEKDKLSRTFKKTYMKVNDTTSADSSLSEDTDNYFTPCSYLAEKNSNADIIHVRLNSKSAASIANTVLCYIKTKGNTSFF